MAINSDARFGEVYWTEEDLRNALEVQDFPATRKNIETLRSLCEQEDFKEAMIQAGWEWIYSKIGNGSYDWDIESNDYSDPDVVKRIFTPGTKVRCTNMQDPYSEGYLKALPGYEIVQKNLDGKSVFFFGDRQCGYFVYDESALLLVNAVGVIEPRKVDLTKSRCRIFIPGERVDTYIALLQNQGINPVLSDGGWDGYQVFHADEESSSEKKLLPIGRIEYPYRVPKEFCDPEEFKEHIGHISPNDPNAKVVFYGDEKGELVCKGRIPAPANGNKGVELSPYIYRRDQLCIFPIFEPCIGIVESTDDEGKVYCKWENGRSLPLIPSIDEFEILREEEETE